jgi:guanylate kinase
MSHGSGLAIIVAGPSGVGKGTVIEKICEARPDILTSISHTSRPPRSHEREGIEYFFHTKPQFELMIEDSAFIEWAQVHGNFYGTSKQYVFGHLDKGENIIFEVDVVGAKNLLNELNGVYPLCSVFLLPPNMEDLEKRLIGRGTEDAATIALRVDNAKKECEERKHFDFEVINDRIDRATQKVLDIISNKE